MNTNTDARKNQLAQWAQTQTHLKLDGESIHPASADASFRRYFRANTSQPEHPTVILMDAPPPQEDVRPFIEIAQRLLAAGVNVPKVLAADVERGFLALTDLGNATFLSVLNNDNCRPLYKSACDALVTFQVSADTRGLPVYDKERLAAEMSLFPQWYVEKHMGCVLTAEENNDLQRIFELLATQATAQPGVLVHRDYHSRNLMFVEADLAAQRGWPAGPGILDFQDAVVGPATYDLVSLLRDAYVEWEKQETLDWAIRYWELAKKAGVPVDADPSEFYRQYEWMGLQRHLKVLGIFARLYHRDGKDGYLKDLPLVLAYTRNVAESFSVFKPLIRILDRLEKKEVKVGYTF
ncbi:MAG: phosphotransferase [Burkholderiales bacterium]|jgi:aminoglycoside/choline kinase family phosphotransferase|nr:phosphotransferase [Burkholderiales bacterium]